MSRRRRGRPSGERKTSPAKLQSSTRFATWQHGQCVERTAPKAQWLGKYQSLDTARAESRTEPRRDWVERQQREDSDRRQTPAVERHRQIERTIKNPDYRTTAHEVSSRDAAQARHSRLQKDSQQREQSTERDDGRSQDSRGGRKR